MPIPTVRPSARACSRTASKSSQPTSFLSLPRVAEKSPESYISWRPSWKISPWSYGISSGRTKFRSRTTVRSSPRSAAIASMVRSITKQPWGRPAPRYGVTITVLV
jgi:hypothetical protein